MGLTRELARTSLEIKSIELNDKSPFLWASGFFMPIYNDNRMLLAQYEHRMLVTMGLRRIIEEQEIPVDMIAGTSTAGIAPAASLALSLHVPLVITEGGKSFVFRDYKIETAQKFDAVATTTPWAIPFGVSLANDRKIPFMYVRPEPKTHGLKKPIEGIPISGQKVMLIDFYIEKGYTGRAIYHLDKKGVDVVEVRRKEISSLLVPQNLNGAHIPVIEDVVSTGGSSAKAAQEVRNNGGQANNLLSIFSYGFSEAKDIFDGVRPYDKDGNKLQTPCNACSILSYDVLLEEAQKTGYITDAQVQKLREWRADPFNWGTKHGFQKVEKK